MSNKVWIGIVDDRGDTPDAIEADTLKRLILDLAGYTEKLNLEEVRHLLHRAADEIPERLLSEES